MGVGDVVRGRTTATVVVAVMAFAGCGGGSSGTSIGSSPSDSSAVLSAPLRIGEFVAQCDGAPCTTVTTALARPDNIISQPYVRDSPRQSLVLSACRCDNLAASELVQRSGIRAQFGADASVITVDSNGTQYTCMTGSAPPGQTTAVSACAWNAGPTVYSLVAIPAVDPQTLIELAPLAQVGTAGG